MKSPSAPRALSKSRLVAFRQCPKRLWLEVHRRELRTDSATTQAVFRRGHEVGYLARRLADPLATGSLVDLQADGIDAALALTSRLLQGDKPIFEAGFRAAGGLAFADLLMPIEEGSNRRWAMVEVKSSTSVKPYFFDDVAIQSRIAVAAGVDLARVAVAHVDATWTYPGGGDYRGLLVEVDVTAEAFSRHEQVDDWIAQAHAVVACPQPPVVAVGSQCTAPFACGFRDHCAAGQAVAEFPLAWLPGQKSAALQRHVTEHGVSDMFDMRDVPEALLSPLQRRVREVTTSGRPFIDAAGLARALGPHPLPAYFLDFEAVQFAVPRWPGTRPYQMLAFQFSVHRLGADGSLGHAGFLDVSSNDPSLPLVEALLDACREPGPVFVYNGSFEGARIEELAQRFPEYADALLKLRRRLVDLYPITLRHFCHPVQRGSWSLKRLLPAVAPELHYGDLPGVRDGDMAMQAYLEAIDPSVTAERRAAIEDGLARYCELDTRALVELFRCLHQHGLSSPTP